MKKHSFIIALFVFIALACSSGKKGEEVNTIPEKASIDPNKTYTLKEAASFEEVTVSAQGLGTYKKLAVVLKNSSESSITLVIPAGSHFQNPIDEEQSLITSESSAEIILQAGDSKTVEVATFCTNAKRQVPGSQSGWVYEAEYKGGLDEVISFYGKHALLIDQWLEKKNPEKFARKEDRMLFFQVVIWSYQGAEYDDIVNMLSQDVFADDITAAKKWLDEVYKEAVEIAQLIKNKDSEGLEKWAKDKLLAIIPSNKQIDNAVGKAKDGLNNLRDRLKN
jgi:hypothetical protein